MCIPSTESEEINMFKLLQDFHGFFERWKSIVEAKNTEIMFSERKTDE